MLLKSAVTGLSRSVWKNLDLGRVYRPQCVTYRAPVRLIRANYRLLLCVKGRPGPSPAQCPSLRAGGAVRGAWSTTKRPQRANEGLAPGLVSIAGANQERPRIPSKHRTRC